MSDESNKAIPTAEPPTAGNVMPEPRIRFAAINEAWDIVKAERTTWVLITLIYTAYTFLSVFAMPRTLAHFGLSITSKSHTPFSFAPDLAPHRVAAVLIEGIIRLPFSAFFAAGMYRVAVRQLRGDKISFADVFNIGDIYWSMLGLCLLIWLSYGCGVYTYFPGGLFAGVLALSYLIIVDRRTGPVEALRLSWRMLKKQFVTALIFHWAAALASGIGMLACGVGVLFTLPVGYLAIAIVYRDFFGWAPASIKRIEMPFPPTDASGFRET